MSFFENIFITYIYQPFFNILVGLYWAIGKTIGEYDIGLAVILFAIVVRIIMLPLNIVGDRSAEEKREVSEKVKELEKLFRHDPVKLKNEKKKTIKSKPAAIIGESITIFIQAMIVLMLYRIFKTGLEGADLHLLYDFMPSIKTPINLMFLGQFDLSKTSFTLNTLQSVLIFLLEALLLSFSSIRPSRKEFISLTIFLPISSFILFAFLPSGKKLFIITSLVFSIFMVLFNQFIYWYQIVFSIPKSDPEPEAKIEADDTNKEKTQQ